MFEEIVKLAHKNGIKFTFDQDCDVVKCQNVAIWEQDITHQEEGKITLNLCDKHLKDFDNNKAFNVKIKND